MKPNHLPANNEDRVSSSRRKIVTGLLGVSAVATLAPQHWTQPVLTRIIAPAHGQAVSIAAGTYRVTLALPIFDEDGVAQIGNCVETVVADINWPGGVDPQVVLFAVVTITRSGDVGDQCGNASEGDGELLVFVAASGSQQTDAIELTDISPPLPAGLSFFAAGLSSA